MKKNFDDFISKYLEGDRAIDPAIVNIDSPLLIEQIKEDKGWKDGKRNIITVFKTNALRIMIIALPEGAEMPRHTADGTISVQVLEGQMQFSTDKQTLKLNKGQMLALHDRIPHSVLAIRETIFLLSLTTNLPVEGAHL